MGKKKQKKKHQTIFFFMTDTEFDGCVLLEMISTTIRGIRKKIRMYELYKFLLKLVFFYSKA